MYHPCNMMSAHTKVVEHVFMLANFVPLQRLSCVHVHTHVLYCICACSSVCVALFCAPKISPSRKFAYVLILELCIRGMLMMKLKLPYHVAATSSIKIGEEWFPYSKV